MYLIKIDVVQKGLLEEYTIKVSPRVSPYRWVEYIEDSPVAVGKRIQSILTERTEKEVTNDSG